MSRTYSNVVVAGSRSKATLAVGFEMCRVDGGIVVMPIYDEGRALHRDIRLAVDCLPERCRCLQVCSSFGAGPIAAEMEWEAWKGKVGRCRSARPSIEIARG